MISAWLDFNSGGEDESLEPLLEQAFLQSSLLSWRPLWGLLAQIQLMAAAAGYLDLYNRLTSKLARERSLRLSPFEFADELPTLGRYFTLDEDEMRFPQEAYLYLSRLKAVDRPLYDQLAGNFKRISLTAAGMTTETIDTKLRQGLLSAVKEGITLRDFRKRVGEEQFLSRAHCETVFRTNVQTAYSAGQLAVLAEPGMVDEIAGANIAVVLDDHTSAICRPLAGLFVPVLDILNGNFLPPFHYRCRTTLDYITRFEESRNPPLNSISGEMPESITGGFGKAPMEMLRDVWDTVQRVRGYSPIPPAPPPAPVAPVKAKRTRKPKEPKPEVVAPEAGAKGIAGREISPVAKLDPNETGAVKVIEARIAKLKKYLDGGGNPEIERILRPFDGSLAKLKEAKRAAGRASDDLHTAWVEKREAIDKEYDLTKRNFLRKEADLISVSRERAIDLDLDLLKAIRRVEELIPLRNEAEAILMREELALAGAMKAPGGGYAARAFVEDVVDGIKSGRYDSVYPKAIDYAYKHADITSRGWTLKEGADISQVMTRDKAAELYRFAVNLKRAAKSMTEAELTECREAIISRAIKRMTKTKDTTAEEFTQHKLYSRRAMENMNLSQLHSLDIEGLKIKVAKLRNAWGQALQESADIKINPDILKSYNLKDGVPTYQHEFQHAIEFSMSRLGNLYAWGVENTPAIRAAREAFRQGATTFIHPEINLERLVSDDMFAFKRIGKGNPFVAVSVKRGVIGEELKRELERLGKVYEEVYGAFKPEAFSEAFIARAERMDNGVSLKTGWPDGSYHGVIGRWPRGYAGRIYANETTAGTEFLTVWSQSLYANGYDNLLSGVLFGRNSLAATVADGFSFDAEMMKLLLSFYGE